MFFIRYFNNKYHQDLLYCYFIDCFFFGNDIGVDLSKIYN